MAVSRKRPGHPYRKKADIPASQRVKGRVIWAVLIAVFAVLVAYFGAGANWMVLIVAGVAGAVIGYAIGKSMEQEAAHK